MNIILIGFKSCGKSTIGQALAEHLGLAFADTDALLEARHAALQGEHLAFRAIYQQYGKAYFRGLERDVLGQLGDLREHVIAAGGGTFIHHSLPPAVRQTGMIVYLAVRPAVLMARIRAGGVPSFFSGDNFEQEFADLYQQREPVYRELADLTLEVSDLAVSETVYRIAEQLCLLGTINPQ